MRDQACHVNKEGGKGCAGRLTSLRHRAIESREEGARVGGRDGEQSQDNCGNKEKR